MSRVNYKNFLKDLLPTPPKKSRKIKKKPTKKPSGERISKRIKKKMVVFH